MPRPARSSHPPVEGGAAAKSRPTEPNGLEIMRYMEIPAVYDAWLERLQKGANYTLLQAEDELKNGSFLETTIEPSVFKEIVLKPRSRQEVAKLRAMTNEVYMWYLQSQHLQHPTYTLQEVEDMVQDAGLFKNPDDILYNTGLYCTLPESPFAEKTESEQKDFIQTLLNSEPDFSRVARGDLLKWKLERALDNTGDAIGDHPRLAIGA